MLFIILLYNLFCCLYVYKTSEYFDIPSQNNVPKILTEKSVFSNSNGLIF